jgi:hypothetical protein
VGACTYVRALFGHMMRVRSHHTLMKKHSTDSTLLKALAFFGTPLTYMH